MKSAASTSHPKPRPVRRSRRACSWQCPDWAALRHGVAPLLAWGWRLVRMAGGGAGRALICIWRLVRWVGSGICRACCWLWRCGLRIEASLRFHLLAPALCFLCIYLGVLSTLSLPKALWGGLLPGTLAPATFPVLTNFPLAPLPDPASIPSALLIAIPLALAVFKHHHQEWQDSSEPLLARMLFAGYAGVSWSWAWFRRWRANS